MLADHSLYPLRCFVVVLNDKAGIIWNHVDGAHIISILQRRRKLNFIGKAKTTPMWVCPDHFH